MFIKMITWSMKYLFFSSISLYCWASRPWTWLLPSPRFPFNGKGNLSLLGLRNGMRTISLCEMIGCGFTSNVWKYDLFGPNPQRNHLHKVKPFRRPSSGVFTFPFYGKNGKERALPWETKEAMFKVRV